LRVHGLFREPLSFTASRRLSVHRTQDQVLLSKTGLGLSNESHNSRRYLTKTGLSRPGVMDGDDWETNKARGAPRTNAGATISLETSVQLDFDRTRATINS
jgi:hypothetical protein